VLRLATEALIRQKMPTFISSNLREALHLIVGFMNDVWLALSHWRTLIFGDRFEYILLSPA
jgi:hypothetical protein